MSLSPQAPNAEVVEKTIRPLDERTALACYLSTVVAIGNCMADVCPPVGAMYRDRLLKLPRRLAFDATPQALQQSREVVETDLMEYASTASEWINTGSNHAIQLLDHLRATEETLTASADLQRAFLEDLAEHVKASAEVDEEAQLRASVIRCASGLIAYARRAKAEKMAMIDDLRQRREEIEAWLSEATTSTYTDPDTGLLNRAAAERRIQTEVGKQKPFCAIVVSWKREGKAPSRQGMKELSERLAASIRPYDIIFRWSQDQLLTIFESSEAGIRARAQQIAAWLGDPSHTTVSVVEHADEGTGAALIERIESLAVPA